MITKEQLNKYYSEYLDELVEWADDLNKLCLYAYLDEDDNLYCGPNQLHHGYTQFRVPLQAKAVVMMIGITISSTTHQSMMGGLKLWKKCLRN